MDIKSCLEMPEAWFLQKSVRNCVIDMIECCPDRWQGVFDGFCYDSSEASVVVIDFQRLLKMEVIHLW